MYMQKKKKKAILLITNIVIIIVIIVIFPIVIIIVIRIIIEIKWKLYALTKQISDKGESNDPLKLSFEIGWQVVTDIYMMWKT